MGVALAEVYDLSPDSNSILANVSTRALVEIGDNVMIGGFIIHGYSIKEGDSAGHWPRAQSIRRAQCFA